MLYIALARSYVVSMAGLFCSCIENAMFLPVKWNLPNSYAVLKVGTRVSNSNAAAHSVDTGIS